MASFIRTVRAPATPKSSAVTGSPALQTKLILSGMKIGIDTILVQTSYLLEATTILPKRSLMSARLVVKAKTAMISLNGGLRKYFYFSAYICTFIINGKKPHLATVMSNWVSLSEHILFLVLINRYICMKIFVC